MYVWGYLCVKRCVYAYVHGCRRQKITLGLRCCSSKTICLSPAWSSPSREVWLASKSQRSSFFCLPSAGITGTYTTVATFFFLDGEKTTVQVVRSEETRKRKSTAAGLQLVLRSCKATPTLLSGPSYTLSLLVMRLWPTD